MTHKKISNGAEELRKNLHEHRGLFWFIAVFSFLTNLLMLTGPIYMLQVYDRVLGSKSYETLLALSLVVVFLYATMGILDYVRGRITARIGANFQAALDKRVFDASLRKSAILPASSKTSGLSDLEAIQRFMTSPVFLAVFDMPWAPFFIFGIMIFHPILGYLAIAGGIVLVAMALFNQIFTSGPVQRANQAGAYSEHMAATLRSEAETIQSLGMSAAVFHRWHKLRENALTETLSSSDYSGVFNASTKTFRLFLQSAMLGTGAYLVLQNELTPGAMIAGSILLGRALAPIEASIGQWQLVQRAKKGWTNLSQLLSEVPDIEERTPLPKPKAKLEAQNVTVVPPGEQQAALKALNFIIEPGSAVGVLGLSGAGKSTLAKALTGVWRPAGGKLRLGGASLDNYDRDILGQHIGYLPQRVQLFEGTIAENIAKLSPSPDSQAVISAAQRADAHNMILQLPDGYDTKINASGGRLSGGQIQRIGLARALYGDPVILVLDEPNSNLDNNGNIALNNCIRSMKAEEKTILIMAHRPNAIEECDYILMLDQGMKTAFGPKDEVLRQVLKNHSNIVQAPTMGTKR